MREVRYRRRSSRVILLDGQGRVLLFRFLLDRHRPELGQCWLTPGGGVDRGESLVAAAARELHEETGLRVRPDELLGPVAHTSGYADLGWAKGVFRDDFFVHRVAGHDVDTSAFEQVEAATITGHRWWTVDDLGTAPEPVYPYGLQALVVDLLAGRVPAEPIELPWHH